MKSELHKKTWAVITWGKVIARRLTFADAFKRAVGAGRDAQACVVTDAAAGRVKKGAAR